MIRNETTRLILQSWDRESDESLAAYARFLIYRNLGPARSLSAAYRTYAGEAPKGPKRPAVPGNWKKEAARHRWSDRAAAWDIAMFAEQGRRSAAAMAALLEALAVAAIRALHDGETAEERAEGLRIWEALAPYATPAAVAALAFANPNAESLPNRTV